MRYVLLVIICKGSSSCQTWQTSLANIHHEIQKSADSSDGNVVLVSQTYFSSPVEPPRKIQKTLGPVK